MNEADEEIRIMTDDGDYFFVVPEPDITFDLGRLPSNDLPLLPSPPADGPESGAPSPGPSPSPTQRPTDRSGNSLAPTRPASEDSLEGDESESAAQPIDKDLSGNTTARTSYWSCPPPSPVYVSGTASDGTEVSAVLPSGVSTAVISYGLEVTLTDDDELAGALGSIERRVGESLASAMAGEGDEETGEGEGDCAGYPVDFRLRARVRRRQHEQRRSLRRARDLEADPATTETEPTTRIIGIASGPSDFAVDESSSCRVPREGCYPVQAAVEATYVGTNESGVRSAVSRAVQQEVADSGNGFEFEVVFVGATDETSGSTHHTPAEPNIFTKLMNDIQEALPDNSQDRSPTPVGLAMMAGLGCAFLAVCYVVFVKSDRGQKAKRNRRTRKEKRMAKRTPLKDGDGEVRAHAGAGSDADKEDYCYDLKDVSYDYCADLEDVAVVNEGVADSGDYDHGLELSLHPAVERKDSVDAGTSCGRTRRVSNRSPAPGGGGSGTSDEDRQYLADFGLVAGVGWDDEEEGEGPPGLDAASDSSGSDSGATPDGQSRRGGVLRTLFSRSRATAPPSVPVEDSERWEEEQQPSSPNSAGSMDAIHRLPSISEADQRLPPPANDTRHRRGAARQDCAWSGGVVDEISEI